MNEFIEVLKSRGYFYQCTNLNGLEEVLKSGPITAYIGFDCTAPSLHIGSLVQIMLLRLLKQYNHHPIILLGGGTTKIGDPSGKEEGRKLLSDNTINANKQGIAAVLYKFLNSADSHSSNTNLQVVDNTQWLDELNYITFLRDIGKHFSINRMLNFESVKTRLEREQNLSFLEFNYMLLQAYDFVQLFKNYNCRLQLGGSDQWGNIVNGVDLARKLNLPELYGLTTPLITTAAGTKMGKTAKGAIWLEKEQLSPYEYWQFFRNTADQDVIKFLKLFTELPLEEINRLEKLKNRDINEAKKILATEATKICHGEIEALTAENAASREFENDDSSFLPNFTLRENSTILFKALVHIEFATSSSEAKRLIKSGAVKINDTTICDPNFLLIKESKISVAKKRALLKLTEPY